MSRLLVVEAILTIVVVVAALARRRYDSLRHRKLWHFLNRLAQRRVLSVIGIGVLALILRVCLLPIMPVPEPRIHDEFSYLLAADTFASGRLTNPPHPMWVHFESFHVNQLPTYSSIYPPLQGVVLAAGKIFAGHPWIGVLLSVSLMCSALCWMLQAWLPARWAFLGGLIGVIRLATFSYWGNSYWGGAVPALGGLLVLGAIPRLWQYRVRFGYVFALGFGMIILANSRPYEGLILCMPVAVLLGRAVLKVRFSSARFAVKRHMLLLLLLLITATVMMGWYFWRVTGNPFKMPYQVNERNYWMARAFLWQSPNPEPQYRHAEIRNFYELWLRAYVRQRSSLRGFLNGVTNKMTITWLFYIGPVLSLSLIGFPKAVLDQRMRPLVMIGVVAAIGLLAESWFFPHYVAPFVGLIYALLLQSMRHLSFWRLSGHPKGRSLVLTIPIVSLVMFILVVMMIVPAKPVQGRYIRAWCCAWTGPSERSRVLTDLNAQGGQHLVIVRYSADHDLNSEWVYNDASVDNAEVVFARDMGTSKNAELVEYFKGRKVWLLEPDERPLSLIPYH